MLKETGLFQVHEFNKVSTYMDSFLSQVLKPIMHLNNPANQKTTMVFEFLLFFLIHSLSFFIDSQILVLIYAR